MNLSPELDVIAGNSHHLYLLANNVYDLMKMVVCIGTIQECPSILLYSNKISHLIQSDLL